jgi:WD40 repeat protein
LDFSASRQELAVGASDGAIYLLDANSLEIREIIRSAHGSSVFSIQYSPDEMQLFSGGRDAMLNVWALADGFKKTSSQPAHWYTINSIVFSPDGQRFATGSRDKTLKIWDLQTMELLKVLEGGRDGGHFNSVNRLLWLPSHLVSCSDDRTAIAWKVE